MTQNDSECVFSLVLSEIKVHSFSIIFRGIFPVLHTHSSLTHHWPDKPKCGKS